MKKTQNIMGMPITIQVIGPEGSEGQHSRALEEVFARKTILNINRAILQK